MHSSASTQLFGEYCIGQISDFRAHTCLKSWWRHSGTFSCSCHAVQESQVKAGSCGSRVYPDLSYLQALSRLGMGGSGPLGLFSHTMEHFKHPQFSVGHGRVGGQRQPAGLWDGHLLAHLSQPRSSSRSEWLGQLRVWFSLHPDKLLLPPIPASTSQHGSTASHLAELGWFAAPLLPTGAWHWAAFPRKAASLTFWAALPGLASSAHINWKLLKSSSTSEMAFVRNTAAVWLPSLWPELQCRLQGSSPRHQESYLYPFPNFPACLMCPYTCDRSKTASSHQQQSYTEYLREGRVTHTDNSYCIAFAGSHGEPQTSCKHSSYLTTATSKQTQNCTHCLSSCNLKSLIKV